MPSAEKGDEATLAPRKRIDSQEAFEGDRRWISKVSQVRVFLSSPYQGLEAERQAVYDVLAPDHDVIGMEDFGSSGLPALDTCLEALDSCRACVVILGGRYGSRVPGLDISYTEAEYEHAQASGIPVFAYIHSDFEALLDAAAQSDDDRRRQRDLKRLIYSELTVEQVHFSGPDDLASKAARDIARWAANKKRPRFQRRRAPVKDDLAYAAGRIRRAAGSLYPYPIVLVDLAAAKLDNYPGPRAGRIPRKVHEIHWEMSKKGAQILIFNDLPVIDQTGADVFLQRLETVRSSEALLVCFVRRESDLPVLEQFASAGGDRALVIAVWIEDDTADGFPATFRYSFTSDELSQCAVALRTTHYLEAKIQAHLVGRVTA